ncbi:MAG: signal peptidase II [Desulfatibacillaceae bacterium]
MGVDAEKAGTGKERLDRPKLVRLAAIVVPLVVADQLTKAWILASLRLYDGFAVIPGFFNIIHVRNTGGAFSVFSDSHQTLRVAIFVGGATLALLLVLYLYKQTPLAARWFAASLALVMAGAVGNLIDRLRFGNVVDFLDFHVGSWHWPAFNVADMCITVGVAILAVHFLFKKEPI